MFNLIPIYVNVLNNIQIYVNVLNNIPISNTCFLENTYIKTDQGDMLIKDINPKIHTIKNKKIIYITKTITQDKYLICFEKDSLGLNYPNEKTVMTKSHKIHYKGKFIQAYRFIGHFENVHKIEYNKELLYNILMDGYIAIKANNLICESLHPNNIIAKLYTDDINENYRNHIIKILNKSLIEENNCI